MFHRLSYHPLRYQATPQRPWHRLLADKTTRHDDAADTMILFRHRLPLSDYTIDKGTWLHCRLMNDMKPDNAADTTKRCPRKLAHQKMHEHTKRCMSTQLKHKREKKNEWFTVRVANLSATRPLRGARKHILVDEKTPDDAVDMTLRCPRTLTHLQHTFSH